MVVVPALTRLANPVLLIVATAVFEEVHVTPELMSRTVPSLKVPVAENCCDPWRADTDTFDGVSWIEVRGEVVTVTVVDPDTPSELAEIVAEPGATVVAIPALLINTIVAFEVVQTGSERTFALPFSKVARAVNCCWNPANSEGDGGETDMEAIGVAQNSCPPHDNAMSGISTTIRRVQRLRFRWGTFVTASIRKCLMKRRKFYAVASVKHRTAGIVTPTVKKRSQELIHRPTPTHTSVCNK